MLDKLAPGDVVTVTRTDRLARSTFDLFAIVKLRRVTHASRD
jgi:DNA invertase Pin-like site-specific DNA recombinase